MPARQDTPSVVVASGPRSAAESSWLRWLGLRLALPLVLSLVLFARLSPSPSRSSSDYPFKLEPHFSGQRMVAARDLAAGDFILHARPLLVLPSQFKSPSISAINDEIKGMLQGLELKKRNSFYGLSSAAKGDLPIEMGIVKTNGIDVGDGKVGVFPVVSRINHSCRPNAYEHWNEKTGLLTVRAIAPILSSSEIFIAYTKPVFSLSSRQDHLKEQFDFTCACPRCSRPTDHGDRVRALIEQASRWGHGAKAGVSGNEAVGALRMAVKLMEEDGLWGGRGAIARDCAAVALTHGDYEAAAAWASRSAQWFAVELGWDSDEVSEMLALAGDPRAAKRVDGREQADREVEEIQLPYSS